MFTAVEASGAGLAVRRRISPAFMSWDVVRACDYDDRRRRFAVYRRAPGETGEWVALTRGSARILAAVLQRAEAEGAPLDPQIRLPGASWRGFGDAEFPERLRSARRDVAAESGNANMDQLVQSLAIARANASTDRDDNPLPRAWPPWIGALVLLGAAVLSLLTVLLGPDEASGTAVSTLFPYALFAWGFVAATYKLVSALTIAYLAGGMLASCYAALIVAAIVG